MNNRSDEFGSAFSPFWPSSEYGLLGTPQYLIIDMTRNFG